MGDEGSVKTNIHIVGPLAAEADVQWLRRVAEATLRSEGRTGDLNLTLVITDDEGIRALNKRFLGKDVPTDVLAFGLEGEEDFVLPSGVCRCLGDVIVSYERAREQGPQFGHSSEEELALLVVHGILHLLGYDDQDEESLAVMLARQEEIVGNLASRSAGQD